MLDAKRWRDFSARHGLDLTGEEIGELVESSALDPEEGAEWLPYYKAALGRLSLLVGSLAAWVGFPRPVPRSTLDRVKRDWLLHLVLIGCGPRTEDVSNLVEMARRDTDDCFSELRAMESPSESTPAQVHGYGYGADDLDLEEQ